MREPFGTMVALLPPEEVAAMIAASGFEPPVPCLQPLLIHGPLAGWLARRSACTGRL